MKDSDAKVPVLEVLLSLLPRSKVRAKGFPWRIVPDFVPLGLKNRYFRGKVRCVQIPPHPLTLPTFTHVNRGLALVFPWYLRHLRPACDVLRRAFVPCF